MPEALSFPQGEEERPNAATVAANSRFTWMQRWFTSENAKDKWRNAFRKTAKIAAPLAVAAGGALAIDRAVDLHNANQPTTTQHDVNVPGYTQTIPHFNNTGEDITLHPTYSPYPGASFDLPDKVIHPGQLIGTDTVQVKAHTDTETVTKAGLALTAPVIAQFMAVPAGIVAAGLGLGFLAYKLGRQGIEKMKQNRKKKMASQMPLANPVRA